MSRWHAVRIRDDLYRVIQAQAAEMSRSATGQLDFVLSRALEQETGSDPGRAGQATSQSPSPARAPSDPINDQFFYERQTTRRAAQIERQTTNEMLASCPNCAGELGTIDVEIGGHMQGVPACEDCGYVREGA